jgi:uncharacterized MAPEG superfamily protein
MSVELTLLCFASLLGLAQIVVASHLVSLQRGYRWTAGSREERVAPLTGAANRYRRSARNFLETFPIFAALLLAAVVSHRTGQLTLIGAHLYFWGRLIYVPLYGVPIVRSVIWNVATLGILLIAAALLWPAP